ncbi:3-isopropylmalate dehydrogenase, partial [Streptococcus pneumoniae]
LLKKWSIQIPKNSSSYREVCEMIERSEESFKRNITKELGRK